MGTIRRVFPPEYKESVFKLWYENGQPGVRRMITILPEASNGLKPTQADIERWFVEDDWQVRANKLNSQVQKKTDIELVQKRIDLMKQIEANGMFLVDKGMDYLREKDFENTQTALRAIEKGTEMVREAGGMAIVLEKVLAMSNDDLVKEIMKLTEDVEGIVEAEEGEEDESPEEENY